MNESSAAARLDLQASLPAQLKNCAEFWEGFGLVHEDPDGTRWFRSGIVLAEINGVRRAMPATPGAAVSRVREALEGVPWTWWTAGVEEVMTEQRLHDVGLETVERVPHMAIATSIDTAFRDLDLHVEQIGEDQLPAFVALWVSNFGVPEEFTDPITAREFQRPRRDEQCTYLAGYIDGQMVATALLLTAQGIAGIYCVTTAPEYRGRGIGRAMTLTAIAAARQQNLPVASLQATPDGLPLYRSIGFQALTSYAILTTSSTPVTDARA